jgi:hypothetical protein
MHPCVSSSQHPNFPSGTPSVADLEAKLPWCTGAEGTFECREQFRLSQLELLRPDGAIDLEFEDLAPKAERPTVGRNLRTDCLFPDRADLMGSRDTVQPEITEDPSDDVTDRSRLASAPQPSTAH